MGRGQLLERKIISRTARLAPRQRFRFFLTTFRQLETIDLLYHFVGVNWPSAAAVFDILVDDSLQLLFFNVIKHNSKDEPLLKQADHFWGVDQDIPVLFDSKVRLAVG
jgi:hypothetical protein